MLYLKKSVLILKGNMTRGKINSPFKPSSVLLKPALLPLATWVSYPTLALIFKVSPPLNTLRLLKVMLKAGPAKLLDLVTACNSARMARLLSGDK